MLKSPFFTMHWLLAVGSMAFLNQRGMPNMVLAHGEPPMVLALVDVPGGIIRVDAVCQLALPHPKRGG